MFAIHISGYRVCKVFYQNAVWFSTMAPGRRCRCVQLPSAEAPLHMSQEQLKRGMYETAGECGPRKASAGCDKYMIGRGIPVWWTTSMAHVLVMDDRSRR